MKNFRKCCLLLVATITLFIGIPFTASQAAVINFDGLGLFENYDHYSGSFGSTDDVTVTYQTLNSDFIPSLDYVELWNTGYATLNTAAYPAFNGGILDITLTSTDPSKLVVLNSFDVAAYFGFPDPIDSYRLASVLELRDGAGNVLLDYVPPVEPFAFGVWGLLPQTLTPNLKAHSISILLGIDWDNGINNINFSTSAVPAPSAIILLGSGILGLASVSRRKKQ